ncbi:hypothetical protein PMAYCL1PPCAC_09393, partial [Pristionchus mayeri]
RMNVFFQGFWSDVRTFYKPLDNIRSVAVKSDYIVFEKSAIQININLYININLVPLSVDQFKHFLYGDSTVNRKLI